VLALTAAVVAGKLWLAARWGLLADEAYHWTWARSPALGYYDQPPLVAWALALERSLLGDSALALRLLPVLGWGIAVCSLAPHARRVDTWLWWALLSPALFVLPLLAVPDSLLLVAWALGLASALRGGRGWWLAGLLGGLASLAKYSGIALLPLLICGATAEERRSRDPWVGLSLAVALLLPNLAWNASHDWVTFRFQLGEGLLSPRAPGLWGPVLFSLDQALLLGPFTALAALLWVWQRPADRTSRLCLASSVPLLLGFACASVGGPPEAHWPVPAYLGLGLGLAQAEGRVARLASLGAWLWGLGTLLLVLQVERPLVWLQSDPAARLTEGWHLADEVGRFVIPAAAGDEPQRPVYTERYQEAALLSWHGIEAHVLPGCGRPSQYDLEPVALAPRAWFVRPARGGPPRCALERYPRAGLPQRVGSVDRWGRKVGPWDIIELEGGP
jgi:4-amino-4-deoxy-L-arabinose transferase-like glycosyltransferase